MNKLFLMTLVFLVSCSTTLGIKWKVTDKIKTPESVYFSKADNKIFVSNVDGAPDKKDGKGSIALFSAKGKVVNSTWITGLNAPKGMRALNGKLWVSDIDHIVEIDIEKGKILKKYRVKKAKFLNDIAIDKNGDVYVSDTLTSKIHRLRKGKVTTFVSGKKYESPNGLLIEGNKLLVASWGLTTDWSTKILGRLYSIDLKTKEMAFITKNPLGNLDGLEKDQDGHYLVSDWVAGVIYKIDGQGNSKVIYKGKKGLADIGLLKETNTILIPQMNDNEIIGIQ